MNPLGDRPHDMILDDKDTPPDPSFVQEFIKWKLEQANKQRDALEAGLIDQMSTRVPPVNPAPHRFKPRNRKSR